MTENSENNRAFEECSNLIKDCRKEASKRIVGQIPVLDGILTALIAGGHVLLEGVPGLAKTLAVRTFSDITGLDFKRIQFTPDLLPADVVGTLMYEPAAGGFSVRKGPVFTNLVLADEINRAPAKVQSALLEAMAESQVTIGDQTYKLPDPFFVLATQNPIEHRLPAHHAAQVVVDLLEVHLREHPFHHLVILLLRGECPAVEVVAHVDARIVGVGGLGAGGKLAVEGGSLVELGALQLYLGEAI